MPQESALRGSGIILLCPESNRRPNREQMSRWANKRLMRCNMIGDTPKERPPRAAVCLKPISVYLGGSESGVIPLPTSRKQTHHAYTSGKERQCPRDRRCRRGREVDRIIGITESMRGNGVFLCH
jgi:hypothetical protein